MREYLLGFWGSVDPIYFACTRLRYVADTNQQKTLLRVRLTKYKGARIVLSDGTIIEKNDVLVKIHLHNVKLIKELSTIPNEMKRAVFIYHSIKQAMPNLAMFLQSHPSSRQIKGIIGITSLCRGAERLGFEKSALCNRYYRMYKKATLLPINLLASNKGIEPVYLFMSKNKLLNKYGTNTK
ncbi:hypothetical protein GLV99_01060 [Virgibacillus massiliensis]|nr:hypothetical protein [Virgibacillus massiliensis]